MFYSMWSMPPELAQATMRAQARWCSFLAPLEILFQKDCVMEMIVAEKKRDGKSGVAWFLRDQSNAQEVIWVWVKVTLSMRR